MNDELIRCTVKPAILKKLLIVSSIILIIPSFVFLVFNLYVSILLVLIYVAVVYIIYDVDNFTLSDSGVYVCKRNGRVVYGYKYFEVDSVHITHAGDYVGIKIINNKFKKPHLLVLRDKTQITVPEYVTNFPSFLKIISEKVNDKLSGELKEYIEASINKNSMTDTL